MATRNTARNAAKSDKVERPLEKLIHDLLYGTVENETSLDNAFLKDFIAILTGDAGPAKAAMQEWIDAQTDAARSDAVKKLSARYGLYRVASDGKDDSFFLQTKDGKDATRPARGDKLSSDAIEWHKSLRAFGVFNTRFHRTINPARWLVKKGEEQGSLDKVYAVDKNGVINVRGNLVMSENELENAPLMGESFVPLNGLAGRGIKSVNERAEKELNVQKKTRTTKSSKDAGPVISPKDAMDTFNRAVVSNSKELLEPSAENRNRLVLTLSNTCELLGVLNHVDNEYSIDLAQLMLLLTQAAKVKLGFASDCVLKAEDAAKLPKFKAA